jgi:hypothetical protein
MTPALTSLLGRGFKVALVTDGRMSGASGPVPAAIHLTPEADAGGPIARVRTGDVIRLDARTGTLELLGADVRWLERPPARVAYDSRFGSGRAFAGFRHRLATRAARCAMRSVTESRKDALRKLLQRAGDPVLTSTMLRRPCHWRALVAGGLAVLEVTLRTPAALDSIRAMRVAVPGAVIVQAHRWAVRCRRRGRQPFVVSPAFVPHRCGAKDPAFRCCRVRRRRRKSWLRSTPASTR